MGNCLRKRSAIVWGAEDWGSFGNGGSLYGGPPPKDYGQEKTDGTERKGVDSSSSLSPSSIEGTEVKIKISRKQLEQVMKTAETEGLSAQQVLARLMNVDGGDQFEAAHQLSWKPTLMSIPE